MNDVQWAFIQAQVLSQSVSAAFVRSRPRSVYKRNASEESKRGVRVAIRAALADFEVQYSETPDEDVHIQNIITLSDSISLHHGKALNGRLRIGTAQKALNLYLKYLWCLGRIKEPPHCPIDAIVLASLPGVADIRWTQIDTIADYKRCIDAVRQAANESRISIAEWELRRWNGAILDAKPNA